MCAVRSTDSLHNDDDLLFLFVCSLPLELPGSVLLSCKIEQRKHRL